MMCLNDALELTRSHPSETRRSMETRANLTNPDSSTGGCACGRPRVDAVDASMWRFEAFEPSRYRGTKEADYTGEPMSSQNVTPMIHDPRGPRRRGCRSRGGALIPREPSRAPSSSRTAPFRVWMPLDRCKVVWLSASAPQARHCPVRHLLRLFCSRIGVARMRGSRSRPQDGRVGHT